VWCIQLRNITVAMKGRVNWQVLESKVFVFIVSDLLTYYCEICCIQLLEMLLFVCYVC